MLNKEKIFFLPEQVCIYQVFIYMLSWVQIQIFMLVGPKCLMLRLSTVLKMAWSIKSQSRTSKMPEQLWEPVLSTARENINLRSTRIRIKSLN